ncbi:MAG: type I DNA topoisomerase [Candidatus Omnitrophica bacterium]|nr:type I DNA topoisomerase [Candidatus Omnitrophota bacterium]MDD5429121.1 type I DNA topoisomerase [Candidatus Omnitrophota bacterium]
MSKYLVIVESPTKAKTISSILGKDYEVVSSMGHVVDLPARRISVDVDNDFEPVFKVIPGKEKVIQQLKKKAKKKEIIYLATDPDREGEAISWHIKEQLASKKNNFQRVAFHEITDEALHQAFRHPAKIDMDRVNSQIARRVLDRVVGYKLSPLLWKKIVRGLSAGRVQSIALKFIVEREKEITAFTPKTTFSIEAKFKYNNQIFRAVLTKHKGKKIIFDDKNKTLECIEDIRRESFLVNSVIKRESLRRPPPPHITSLLQQDSFSKLRFSAQKTMLLAQKLYEGVQMGEKMVGFITYMRTDSFHVNPKAKKDAKDFIEQRFGEEYVAQKEYRHKKAKGAQLAHEAIRPTSIFRSPEDVRDFISDDELRLYELIWRRFTAAFMKEARYESTRVQINSKHTEFQANGKKLLFPGYLKALEEVQEESVLPVLAKGAVVELESLEAVEHISKPPFRYNDASLVRLLEEKGIGRPSTYAPIIYTLIKRHYIRKDKRAFVPTDLGIKVSDLLVSFFPKVMDEGFTASMEEKLDEVEKGKAEWNKLLHDFYPSFSKSVELTMLKAKKEFDFSEKTCPQCKGRLVVKWSRKGRFLSCEHFPTCKYAESITTGIICPGCRKGELIERRNRRGQNFYGCSKFPECTYTSRSLPDDSKEAEAEA